MRCTVFSVYLQIGEKFIVSTNGGCFVLVAVVMCFFMSPAGLQLLCSAFDLFEFKKC